MKHIQLIITYSFVSIFVSIGFGLYMRATAKKISSEVLAADSQLWIIEGVVSAGVCLAFALADFISRYHWARYADYVDPVMCIILCLGLLYKPFQIVAESFRDLVDARPADVNPKHLEEMLRGISEKYGLTGIAWMKTRKAGRKIFLTVCYRTIIGTSKRWMRKEMSDEVFRNDPEMDVEILFCS